MKWSVDLKKPKLENDTVKMKITCFAEYLVKDDQNGGYDEIKL